MLTLNLGILAHVDAGKTTLTERLLHDAGVIDALGSVDAGSTHTDTLALERRRGITIRSAVVAFRVGDVTVNLIDTPGHPDFIAEVDRVLGVLDGAVLVVSAVEGVQAQTRILMRALQRLRLPDAHPDQQDRPLRSRPRPRPRRDRRAAHARRPADVAPAVPGGARRARRRADGRLPGRRDDRRRSAPGRAGGAVARRSCPPRVPRLGGHRRRDRRAHHGADHAASHRRGRPGRPGRRRGVQGRARAGRREARLRARARGDDRRARPGRVRRRARREGDGDRRVRIRRCGGPAERRGRPDRAPRWAHGRPRRRHAGRRRPSRGRGPLRPADARDRRPPPRPARPACAAPGAHPARRAGPADRRAGRRGAHRLALRRGPEAGDRDDAGGGVRGRRRVPRDDDDLHRAPARRRRRASS